MSRYISKREHQLQDLAKSPDERIQVQALTELGKLDRQRERKTRQNATERHGDPIGSKFSPPWNAGPYWTDCPEWLNEPWSIKIAEQPGREGSCPGCDATIPGGAVLIGKWPCAACQRAQ